MGENTGEWVLPDDPKLLDYSGPPYYFDEVLHPGQVLINYAERKVEKRHVDRGWHLWPWEYGRLNICWHRAGHLDPNEWQGIHSGMFIGAGSGMLMISALTKLVQKTCGRCCGHSLQETRSPCPTGPGGSRRASTAVQ